MAKYELIQLALKGYSQADFHMANILINTNYENYFDGINGKASIIDYGYALQIPNEKLEIIKENWQIFLENKKKREEAYNNIFEQIITTIKPHGVLLTNYPSHYGWVNDNNKDTYKDLIELHERRQITINIIKNTYGNTEFSLYKISGGKDLGSNTLMNVPVNPEWGENKEFAKSITDISNDKNEPLTELPKDKIQNQIQKELFDYGNVMKNMVQNIEKSLKNNNNTFFEDFSKIMHNTTPKIKTPTHKKYTKSLKRKNTINTRKYNNTRKSYNTK
jgi:hypothetical protein